MEIIGPIFTATLLATAAVLLVVGGCSACKNFLAVSRSEAAWIWALAMFLPIGIFCQQRLLIRPHNQHSDLPTFAAIVVLPLIMIPFVVKLYLKWIKGALTEAEKSPDMQGVRAWLNVGNLVCALLISLCLAIGFGFNFFSMLGLALMTLLAYPLLNMASASFQVVEPKRDDLSAERERVLRMLDDRKITAAESAELLAALSQTTRSQTNPSFQPTPHRRLVLIGSAILLISFFLPWFSYNPGQEMNRMMGQMQNGFTQVGQQPTSDLPLAFPKTSSITVSGGDIQHGLGWWILMLGVTAAVLPYVVNNLDAQSQFKIGLIGLAVGAVMLLYLLTQNMRYVSFGIVLGLVGYILEFMGTLQERRAVWRMTR